jgi:hypothetical protein
MKSYRLYLISLCCMNTTYSRSKTKEDSMNLHCMGVPRRRIKTKFITRVATPANTLDHPPTNNGRRYSLVSPCILVRAEGTCVPPASQQNRRHSGFPSISQRCLSYSRSNRGLSFKRLRPHHAKSGLNKCNGVEMYKEQTGRHFSL